jgi:hypothetical protein
MNDVYINISFDNIFSFIYFSWHKKEVFTHVYKIYKRYLLDRLTAKPSDNGISYVVTLKRRQLVFVISDNEIKLHIKRKNNKSYMDINNLNT